MWSKRLACLLMVGFLLASALLALSPPSLARAAEEEGRPYELRHKGGWLIVNTSVVGLALNERRPFFAWWYVRENTTVYVAHYKALIEYYAWPNTSLLSPHAWIAHLARELAESVRLGPEEANNIELLLAELRAEVMALHQPVSQEKLDEIEELLSELDDAISDLHDKALEVGAEDLASELEELSASLADVQACLNKLRENPNDPMALNRLKMKVSHLGHDWHRCRGHLARWERHAFREKFGKLKDIMREVGREKLFHPPVFSFAEGEWDLDGPHDIEAPNGTVVGIWFTYKLTKVYNPAFKFAEGNITLRCRLYFMPVEERVDEQLNYTVRRAELKQDLVIASWRWNVDLLEELAEELGLEDAVVVPSETGLALRVKLLAFNASGTELTDFLSGLEEPSDLRELLASLRHELSGMEDTVLSACDELTELADLALEDLEEGASPADVSGLLQEMALLVENTLASLEFHEKMLSDLKAKASEAELGNVSALATAVEGLLNEAKAFFEDVNATVWQMMELDNSLELSIALDGLKGELEAFSEAFEEEVDVLSEALREEAWELGEPARQRHLLAFARLGREDVDVRPDECTGREVRARTRVGLKKLFEVRFLSENATLAGWFRFVNASIVRYPNGSVEIMPVELAYLRAGRTLHLFLIYRYFDGGTLEHDPSTGLDVPETAGEEGALTVEAPTGTETSPKVEEEAPGPGPGPGPGPISYLLTPEGLVIVAAVLIAITAVAAWARRRGRTINLY